MRCATACFPDVFFLAENPKPTTDDVRSAAVEIRALLLKLQTIGPVSQYWPSSNRRVFDNVFLLLHQRFTNTHGSFRADAHRFGKGDLSDFDAELHDACFATALCGFIRQRWQRGNSFRLHDC
jgi:hypothetical protein